MADRVPKGKAEAEGQGVFTPAASRGLFVGVSSFEDERFHPVPFAVDDAVDLAHLFSVELGLVSPKHTVLLLAGKPQKPESVARLAALHDRGARCKGARQRDVYHYLGELARDSEARGIFILTVATHGVSDQGEDYLVATDSLEDRMLRTGVAVAEMFEEVALARAERRLLLLDACRERLNAGTRGQDGLAMAKSFADAIARATGLVVLSGATVGGFAYDDMARKNGVFTAAVLDGLHGKAEAGPGGWITVRTLADYAQQQVVEWVRRNRPGHATKSLGIGRRIEATAEALPLARHPEPAPERQRDHTQRGIAVGGPIQTLHETEGRFLQLLLSQFSLHREREKSGVQLRFRFDDFTPTISNAEGKRNLRGKLGKAERTRYQERFDKFLLRSEGKTLKFKDPDFCFRYASAGTLPIIKFVDDESPRQYYCLFYRDVYPIGWNIANGGCDNRDELKNPEITMDRELREELIIADFQNKTRYVFAGDAAKLPEPPGHAVARELWKKKHRVLDLTKLRKKEVSIEWQRGPDSLSIQFGSSKPILHDGFYLNINGEDFGIEVDRIATIRLPRSVILFDGELEGRWLVNSPVALFEVEELNRRFDSGETSFRPDAFFFDAEYYAGEKIDDVLEKFKEYVHQFREPEEVEELQASIRAGTQYGLCPVTARIIRRYLQSRREMARSEWHERHSQRPTTDLGDSAASLLEQERRQREEDLA